MLTILIIIIITALIDEATIQTNLRNKSYEVLDFGERGKPQYLDEKKKKKLSELFFTGTINDKFLTHLLIRQLSYCARFNLTGTLMLKTVCYHKSY